MNDATMGALVAALGALGGAATTGFFKRSTSKADAVETLTQAAVNVVEQLRADNKQLRDDVDRLTRIVEEQQAEVQRCEERYKKLEAVLRLRWDLDADLPIEDVE
jgi:peptidoglycan hydrolase CwlO-like protein